MLQGDVPLCPTCGHITIRGALTLSGGIATYVCRNCNAVSTAAGEIVVNALALTYGASPVVGALLDLERAVRAEPESACVYCRIAIGLDDAGRHHVCSDGVRVQCKIAARREALRRLDELRAGGGG